MFITQRHFLFLVNASNFKLSHDHLAIFMEVVLRQTTRRLCTSFRSFTKITWYSVYKTMVSRKLIKKIVTYLIFSAFLVFTIYVVYTGERHAAYVRDPNLKCSHPPEEIDQLLDLTFKVHKNSRFVRC